MGDAIGKAVEELKDAQQAFLLLPMEATLLELLQQQMCLEKMAAIINDWLSCAAGACVCPPPLKALGCLC